MTLNFSEWLADWLRVISFVRMADSKFVTNADYYLLAFGGQLGVYFALKGAFFYCLLRWSGDRTPFRSFSWWLPSTSLGPSKDSQGRSRIVSGHCPQKKGGKPPQHGYHIIPFRRSQSVFVLQSCKSVFCTSTFSLLYIVLHIEKALFLWYLIGTKRWYQCTGKNS